MVAMAIMSLFSHLIYCLIGRHFYSFQKCPMPYKDRLRWAKFINNPQFFEGTRHFTLCNYLYQMLFQFTPLTFKGVKVLDDSILLLFRVLD